MKNISRNNHSLYRVFSQGEWAQFRANTPLVLSPEEIKSLESLNDPVSLEQVTTIYLPLARLLALYVEAVQNLHCVTNRFFGSYGLKHGTKVPFIIGLAGSVAAGKSTTARLLKALLERWPSSPRVNLVTTDGFLYPNAVLLSKNLLHRKGFPESYDVAALIRFLFAIKAGEREVKAPVYEHLKYDVVEDTFITVKRPDILIIEGLNLLQIPAHQKSASSAMAGGEMSAVGTLPSTSSSHSHILMVSDFFDFSIYLDAPEALLRQWYCERFMTLRATAFQDPRSYFHKYASLTDSEAQETAITLWESINLINLRENILPTRLRADLILTKDSAHAIQSVALRKL